MATKCNIEELKDSFSIVYNFIKENDISSLKVGKYFLDKGIYANIDEYNTKTLTEGKNEAHKKYIDIQVLIHGNEHIYVNKLNNLKLIEKYNIEKDIEFYETNDTGIDYDMHELECLILNPEDGHMPCINDNHILNRKIVFKVPLTYVKDIKCLILDVDGTLTDGKIYMGQDGETFKAFNIKDGYGLANILQSKKVIPVVITGRQSKIVINRCEELGIKELYQGISDKVSCLKGVADKLHINLSNIIYMGDDLNDLPCMEYVKNNGGLVACPNDASKEVLEKADYISSYNGGNGAVREIIDLL